MSKTLPANIVLEKNKLETNNVWYFLVDIVYASGTLRFAKNNEAVTYNGNIYEPFEFKVGKINQNVDGKVPTLALSVSNITKAIYSYVENAAGLVGSEVSLMIVNSALLNEDYTELTLNYTIVSTTIDSQLVNFNLGAPNPINRRFPQDKYNSRYCNWEFKSVECNYTAGVFATCNRTKEDCEERGNLLNFGGYPGLSNDGIRIVK